MLILRQPLDGFCNGVLRSLRLMDESLNNFQKVYCLGEIVNNRMVVNHYKSKGVIFVNTIFDIPPHSTVLIRAHGETIDNINYLDKIDSNIVDTTCPKVSLVRNSIVEKEREGYTILVLGNPEHPEVKGFTSLVTNYIIINDLNDFDFLQSNDKFFLVLQTSFNTEIFERYRVKLEKNAKAYNKLVVILDSICYTTKERQNSAIHISKQADLVLVIGDTISSNTNKLYEIAKKYCVNTHFITDITDLISVKINNIERLGILSGASTPNELVSEVVRIMSDNQKKENLEQSNDFVEMLEEYLPQDKQVSNKYGDTVKVEVVSATDQGIRCSIIANLGKNDSCLISPEEVEIEDNYDPSKYSQGDVFDCMYLNYADALHHCSKKQFDKKSIENKVAELVLAGQDFKLTFNRATKNKTCLVGRLGDYTVIVPSSQILLKPVRDVEKFFNKELKLRVLPRDEKTSERTIFASQRLILEEEFQKKEEVFWSKIQVNNILEGKVKRFGYKDEKPFGAFVSIDGHDCLAHIGDLDWRKVDKPEEILEIGKVYEFVVLNFDRESGKVSLGYKQLQKRPEEVLAEKFPMNSEVKGTVKSFTEKGFSAIIDLGNGIEGNLHISQIADKFIESISAELTIGQEIVAKVIGYDRFNKVKLSIKQASAAVEKAVVETKKTKTAKATKAKDNENPDLINSESLGTTFADLFDEASLKKLKDSTKK